MNEHSGLAKFLFETVLSKELAFTSLAKTTLATTAAAAAAAATTTTKHLFLNDFLLF